MIQSHSSKILAMAESLGSEKGNPMQMRLKDDRWYAAFSYKGKYQGQSLNAYANEPKKAIVNLGKLIEKLERGECPTDLNRTFKNALPFYYEWCATEGEKSPGTILDIKGLLEPKKKIKGTQKPIESRIMKMFEDLAIKDITAGVCKLYKVDREEQGGKKSMIEKELRIIREVCLLFNPNFKLPKFKRWANRGKKVYTTLSYSEVMRVAERCRESSKEYGESYRTIFLLMAYTGLDIGDVVGLDRSHVTKDGFILKDRGKTNERICAYLWEDARSLLKEIKVAGISGKFFNVPNNKAVTTAVLRAFKKERVKGNSKALRHLASSILFNEGLSDRLIKKFIGHSENSRQTDIYLHADKNKIEQGFQGFKKLALDYEKLIESGGGN